MERPMRAAEKPVYTPFEAPYRMAMGLMGLKPEEWIEVDEDLSADLREKRRLLAERPGEVYRELPGSASAQQELLDLLVGHLVEHFPEHYAVDDGALSVPALAETWDLENPGIAALELAGRLVQEDLCLMQRDTQEWRLTGALVCFPTRWRMVEKIGLPLDAIHAPVPGFQDKMAGAVHRFFDHMKVERPVWRLNWSVLDDPALFQPIGHGSEAGEHDITAENAGERLWLRVERQTLRRLPRTDAIVFGIRVHRWPLSRLAGMTDAGGRLVGALDTMPAAMRRYKSVGIFDSAVRGYLARIAPS